MLRLAELKKQPVIDDNDLVVRFAIEALYAVKAKDEHLMADRSTNLDSRYSIQDYGHFWYSHICEGGCYNYALSIYTTTEIDGLTWVRVVPAPYRDTRPGFGNWVREEGKIFDVRKPGNKDLKAFFRSALDVVKKDQNRKPWLWDILKKEKP